VDVSRLWSELLICISFFNPGLPQKTHTFGYAQDVGVGVGVDATRSGDFKVLLTLSGRRKASDQFFGCGIVRDPFGPPC
jgi:hypothetical protein